MASPAVDARGIPVPYDPTSAQPRAANWNGSKNLGGCGSPDMVRDSNNKCVPKTQDPNGPAAYLSQGAPVNNNSNNGGSTYIATAAHPAVSGPGVSDVSNFQTQPDPQAGQQASAAQRQNPQTVQPRVGPAPFVPTPFTSTYQPQTYTPPAAYTPTMIPNTYQAQTYTPPEQFQPQTFTPSNPQNGGLANQLLQSMLQNPHTLNADNLKEASKETTLSTSDQLRQQILQDSARRGLGGLNSGMTDSALGDARNATLSDLSKGYRDIDIQKAGQDRTDEMNVLNQYLNGQNQEFGQYAAQQGINQGANNQNFQAWLAGSNLNSQDRQFAAQNAAQLGVLNNNAGQQASDSAYAHWLGGQNLSTQDRQFAEQNAQGVNALNNTSGQNAGNEAFMQWLDQQNLSNEDRQYMLVLAQYLGGGAAA